MNMNDDEAIGLLNRLLERLHQADLTNFGSHLQIVYVASGGQHVETQINMEASPLTKTHPNPPCLGREEKTLKEKSFDDNTPLSVLFRENHHEELRKVIESWRPYLINDELDKDALVLTHFKFDKKSIHSKEIYVGLLNLANIGALQVSLSQLARYLSDHSNLSNSYTALYQQIKHYRQEWQ